MSEPTPGPYRVRRKWSNGCEVCPEIWAGDEWVATVVGAPHLGHERTLPTAHLLAAAPDLLAALYAAKYFGSQGETHEGVSVSYLIDLAIAKATGGDE